MMHASISVAFSMTRIEAYETMSLGDPDGKLHLLLDFTDRPGDVADPWYTGDFEATWRDVEEGCRGLLSLLRSGNGG